MNVTTYYWAFADDGVYHVWPVMGRTVPLLCGDEQLRRGTPWPGAYSIKDIRDILELEEAAPLYKNCSGCNTVIADDESLRTRRLLTVVFADGQAETGAAPSTAPQGSSADSVAR